MQEDGIRKFENINVTLLAKLGREVLTNPKNIWFRVVKTKYLKEGGIYQDHSYLLK